MGLFNFGKPKDEVLEAKIANLETKIQSKKAELKQFNEALALEKYLEKLNTDIDKQKATIEQLKQEISLANDELGLQEFGFFERRYAFSDSTRYKDRLDSIRMEQKSLVKSELAGVIISPMTLNNSTAQGKAMQKQLIKAMIRGFNGEADALLVKVSVANVDKKVAALRKSLEQINKMYARNQVEITIRYLDSKIEELRLAAEYELQKQEEKELLREQREKEREEKKLQAEIKAKRKQIAKDRDHFQNMIDNVKSMLESAQADEIETLKKQLAEFESKLSELDTIEKDIDYREGHATAGYVYVISNIGSFGEDIYKIGVTRRLDPLERIKELSSASVPFQFDVHALIFSEEAFALETELHKELEQYKVNKVNGRKEYFKVPFSQIKDLLERHEELTIELTEQAEAFEYRQSLLKINNLS